MNILKSRNIWMGISGVLLVLSIIAMAIYGFKPGIDFVGGSMLDIEVTKVAAETTPKQLITDVFKEVTNEDVVVQPISDTRFSIRSRALTNDQKNQVITGITAKGAEAKELQFQSIDASIGYDILRKAILGIMLASLAILAYLAYAFRKVPKPMSSWAFGSAAVVALLTHDVVILLGAYAVIGHFFGAQIDGLFITAMLTLLGFSVHDTIVTFDRARENLARHSQEHLEKILNDSITQTIVRSISTTFTLVVVLLAMLVFGGETLRFFTLALLIGSIVGTYSSIFIATPLLLLWQKSSWDKAKQRA